MPKEFAVEDLPIRKATVSAGDRHYVGQADSWTSPVASRLLSVPAILQRGNPRGIWART